MKTITVVLFASICLTSFNQTATAVEKCRQSQQDIFSGTWKYQNSNEVFIAEIWKDAEGIKGHYKKIIVDADGNQVSVVYDSNKEIGDTGQNWPHVLSSEDEVGQDYTIGGTVIDNTVTNTPNAGGFIDGKFTIQVLNPACFNPIGNTCTLQAQWMVKKMPGLQHPNDPDFNIPTNIILTKQ